LNAPTGKPGTAGVPGEAVDKRPSMKANFNIGN